LSDNTLSKEIDQNCMIWPGKYAVEPEQGSMDERHSGQIEGWGSALYRQVQ